MLTDTNIERRCRYRLEKHGMRLHKVRDGEYYTYDIGRDDTPPPKEKPFCWFDLDELIRYCDTLELNERKAHNEKPDLEDISSEIYGISELACFLSLDFTEDCNRASQQLIGECLYAVSRYAKRIAEDVADISMLLDKKEAG